MSTPTPDTVLSKPAIRLPKFTFIHAPPADPRAKRLSEALADRDNYLGLMDFEESLRGATMVLFCDGYTDCDWTDPDERAKPILDTTLPVSFWLARFRTLYENTFGIDHLAKLAVNDYHKLEGLGPFERFIWRDATGIKLDPFISAFGQDACCSIFFDLPIAATSVVRRLVWLANGISLDEQIAQLYREFNT